MVRIGDSLAAIHTFVSQIQVNMHWVNVTKNARQRKLSTDLILGQTNGFGSEI